MGDETNLNRIELGGESFDFVDILGTGGVGAVLVVRRTTDGHPFALKLVCGNSEDIESRFEKEKGVVERLRGIRSPYIPELVKFGVLQMGEPLRMVLDLRERSFQTPHLSLEGDCYGLLMQLVSGLEVFNIAEFAQARKKDIDADIVEKTFHDSVSALDVIHRNGMAHLDVKLENMKRDEETGNVMLVDFGSACLYDNDCGSTTFDPYDFGSATMTMGLERIRRYLEARVNSGETLPPLTLQSAQQEDLWGLGAAIAQMLLFDFVIPLNTVNNALRDLRRNETMTVDEALREHILPAIRVRRDKLIRIVDDESRDERVRLAATFAALLLDPDKPTSLTAKKVLDTWNSEIRGLHPLHGEKRGAEGMESSSKRSRV